MPAMNTTYTASMGFPPSVSQTNGQIQISYPESIPLEYVQYEIPRQYWKLADNSVHLANIPQLRLSRLR